MQLSFAFYLCTFIIEKKKRVERYLVFFECADHSYETRLRFARNFLWPRDTPFSGISRDHFLKGSTNTLRKRVRRTGERCFAWRKIVTVDVATDYLFLSRARFSNRGKIDLPPSCFPMEPKVSRLSWPCPMEIHHQSRPSPHLASHSIK